MQLLSVSCSPQVICAVIHLRGRPKGVSTELVSKVSSWVWRAVDSLGAERADCSLSERPMVVHTGQQEWKTTPARLPSSLSVPPPLWRPTPLSSTLQLKNRTCCHHHDSLRLDKHLSASPHPLTSPASVVLTERLVFQVQDVSINTFWRSPFIRPSQLLWSDHGRAVNLPPWRRRGRLLFAPSLIIVCSAVWRSLFMSVDIWLGADIWYVLTISVMCECHSWVQCRPWELENMQIFLLGILTYMHAYTEHVVLQTTEQDHELMSIKCIF